MTDKPDKAPIPFVERVAAGTSAVVIPSDKSVWLSEGLPVRAYVLGGGPGHEDGCVLIDAGYAQAASVEAIAAAIGERRLAAILLTHRHPDHEGGAAALAARFGAPVRAAPGEAASWGADPALAPTPLEPGDTVELCGRRLVAVAAPGHTRAHLCFHEPARGLLYTGDTVLGEGSVLVGPPDGDMAAYLETLARLQALAPLETLLPGHGPPVAEPARKLEALARHRRLRASQIEAALRASPMAPDDLVRTIYAGTIPDHLLGLAAISVLGTLTWLTSEGRAAETASGLWRATTPA